MPKGTPKDGPDPRLAVISPEGVEYPSMRAAAKAENITADAIKKRCQSDTSKWRFKLPRKVKRLPLQAGWPEDRVSPEDAYAGFEGY